MSGLYEVLSWLVYALAAVVMLGAIAFAVLAGVALRLAARFLLELGDSPDGGDARGNEESRAG